MNGMAWLAAGLVLAVPGSAGAGCGHLERAGIVSVETLLDHARCLERELAGVRSDLRRLEGRLESQEAALARLPEPYRNIDGRVERAEGRGLERATFVLTARPNGAASSLGLDPEVVATLCGKSGGCTASLQLHAYATTGAIAVESVLSGRCQFVYAAESGRWTRAAGCGDPEPASGIDGDGKAFGGALGSETILASGGGCLLSDAEAGRRVDGSEVLASDRALGLHLVAAPSLRGGEAGRFACELVLE